MTAILFIPALVWLVFLILTILSQTFLWQRKEYRWDRFRSYLRSPEFFIPRHYVLAVAYICGIIAVILAHTSYITYSYLTIGLSVIALGVFFGFHIVRILTQGIFRPEFTLKALLIIAAVILFNHFIIAHLTILWTLPLLIVAVISFLITPILVALSVFLINIPANIKKQSIIKQANQLRSTLSHTQVIGITGSYGKTSTKHFLSQILFSSHKNIKATKEHRNSEIGVAMDMLEQLTPDTNIYIAEMGAYRAGEIAAITAFAKPHIGIITAIGNQHLDIFSSQEALAQAKKELVNSLPSDGIAILNADDPILRTWTDLPSQKTIWYSTKSNTADISTQNISIEPASILCDIHIAENTYSVTIPLASNGLLSSVLAAVAGAYAVGMNGQDIVSALNTLKPFSQTMEVVKGVQGSTIIDDSYSGGYHAALNAIEHLFRFSQVDKRIVFVPIIELGKDAEKVHEHIGQELAKSGATVYIYGHQYKQALERGLQGSSVTWIDTPKQLVNNVAQNLSSNTVILLEGRVPKSLREALKSGI